MSNKTIYLVANESYCFGAFSNKQNAIKERKLRQLDGHTKVYIRRRRNINPEYYIDDKFYETKYKNKG